MKLAYVYHLVVFSHGGSLSLYLTCEYPMYFATMPLEQEDCRVCYRGCFVAITTSWFSFFYVRI